jgi:8-oxo-dGTP pyrophosphatase MutT (NUDIX family)
MVASSILPVALYKGKLYFLFGKENEMEDSAPGFSDFGGSVENDESIMETALREGSEELCGFLGEPDNIRAMLKGGVFPLLHETYHIHIFSMAFDHNLPCYFTNHHRFLWQRMDKQILNKSKFFEKQEIRWFSIEDMRKNKNQFRGFYQNIVDLILSKTKEITGFVKKIGNKNKRICSQSRTTRKMKGG